MATGATRTSKPSIVSPRLSGRRLALLCSVLLSACAATSPLPPPEQRDALIAQLQAAKQSDLKNALTPGINPVTQGDFMRSAGKVDEVVAKLQQGQYVSQRDLNLALTVPPASMTPEQRQDYINQLLAARKMDQQGIADYSYDSPNKVEDFQVRIRMVDQTIAHLRSPEPVSWWEIQQALHTPQNP
jgi:type IV pilus biogenesis protein CpaD/CtpE